MRNEEISNLPIEEFDRLAKKQTTLFPDLLYFGSEEDIINDFYEYYRRKREKEK